MSVYINQPEIRTSGIRYITFLKYLCGRNRSGSCFFNKTFFNKQRVVFANVLFFIAEESICFTLEFIKYSQIIQRSLQIKNYSKDANITSAVRRSIKCIIAFI